MNRQKAYDSRAHGPATVVEAVEIPRRGPAVALDEILEAGTARLDLPSGRSVECLDPDGRGETVTIRSPRGQVELQVVLTDAGPVLRFDAAQLELRSTGDVRVDCNRFEVQASDGIVQRTGGDAAIHSKGDLDVRARITEISSTRGDVRIRANDDVKLNGERVKLNC